MSLAEDLGVLGNLAVALGLLDDHGDFQSDWLTAPGDHLRTILADDGQRQGLVDFVDEVLDEHDTVHGGVTWLPVVVTHDPELTVAVTLDDTPADHIEVGIGAKLANGGGTASLELTVPLFRAAKKNHTVSNVLLLGDGGTIGIAADLTIDTTEPVPGEAHIGGVAVSVQIPTGGQAPDPTLALTIRDLQLPGATSPSTFSLDATGLEGIEHALLQLVIGVARAQADALGNAVPELGALMGLLGLRTTSTVPPLPIDELLTHGFAALAAWLVDALGDAHRAAWLTELADLLGGTVAGDEVTFTVGGDLHLAIGIRVGSAPSGHTAITPYVSARIGTGDVAVVAEADLVTIDTAGPTATALPSLEAIVHLGKRPDGGSVLLPGDPGLEGLRVGVGLDAAHRPTLVVAAETVTIGGPPIPVLDLSNPDAIAAAGAAVLDQVVAALVAHLGSTVPVLLGLGALPAGLTGVDVLHFVQDPLAALAGYWRTNLGTNAGTAALLGAVHDLVSDNSVAGLGVIAPTGANATPDDPWRIPLIGPVELQFWMAGNVVSIALDFRVRLDTLAGGCTRVETNVRSVVAEIDLAGPHARFLASVDASIGAMARGQDTSVFDLGPVSVTADRVSLVGSWKPNEGLAMSIDAPNLALDLGDLSIPVPLPVLHPDGTVTLDPAAWSALESAFAVLAAQSGVPWLARLTDALGWREGAPRLGAPHLALGDLVDPAHSRDAIAAWVAELLLDDDGAIVHLLTALARLLTGARSGPGRFSGRGTPDDPWAMPLHTAAGAPELVVWLGPDGPPVDPTAAPTELRRWRPGSAGLEADVLARALATEAEIAADIDALLSGRADPAVGLDALVTRWTGTDGIVAPPPVDPPGVVVHHVDDVAASGLADAIDVAALVGGGPPAAVVHVALGAGVWATAPDASRVVHLTDPGLAPAAFAAPAPAGGDWWVELGGRAAAALGTGDPDGTAGQAARLARVLDALAPQGSITVVAHGGAGHAAFVAAQAQPAVTALVTFSTAWSPVTLAALDAQPGADALRLLGALLPSIDPTEPDDPDLANARALVNGFLDHASDDDPARDLRSPATDPGAPRGGLAVHAVFGVLGEDTVKRAITAAIASGLATRAQARATPRQQVSSAHVGVRLSFAPAGTTVTAEGSLTIGLLDVVAGDGGAAPSVTVTRSVFGTVALRRAGGWLVGGPDPRRAPGSLHDHDLRWVSGDIAIDLTAGTGTAQLVLHEARVFGVSRAAWDVRPTTDADATDATPNLPEVRVLLSLVADALHTAAAGDTVLSGALDVLGALGLLTTTGSVPDAVDHLLHDPAAHVAAMLADSAARTKLVAGARTLTGLGGDSPDRLALTAGPATVTVDLAARTAHLDLVSTPTQATRGLVSASLDVQVGVSGLPTVTAVLGGPGTSPAGGLAVRLATSPALTVQLERHRPGAPAAEVVPIWPSPDAARLARLAAVALPAEVARAALEALRTFDAAATVILDAGLDALGLLGPDDGTGSRPVRLAAGLIEDPVGWFHHPDALGGGAGLAPAKAAALLDALRPLLGVPGGPGRWDIASGIAVTATDAGSGALRLGLSVDTSQLAAIPNIDRLPVTVTAGILLAPGAPAAPQVELAVGLTTPVDRQAVHVVLDSTGLRVFLRPASGADIELFPHPAGLGALAGAVEAALPKILDAIAAETGNDVAGTAGALVRAVGDVADLRPGGQFDAGRLQAWAADPAAALAARLPALAAGALQAIVTAIEGSMPAGVTITMAGDELHVTAAGVTLAVRPAPLRVSLAGTVSSLPVVDAVDVGVTLDATGLAGFSLTVGPAAVDAGIVVLRPVFTVVGGGAPDGGRKVELGLGLDPAGDRTIKARWLPDTGTIALVATDHATESTDPVALVAAALEATLDIVAGFVLDQPAIVDVLDTAIGGGTIGSILDGAVLDHSSGHWRLGAGLTDPAQLGDKVLVALANFAATDPTVALAELTVGLSGGGGDIGLHLGLTQRFTLNPDSDVTVSLEFDSSWIEGNPAPGIGLALLHVAGGNITFTPGLEVDGVGVRVAKSSGPLIDLGVTLDSVALHGYGRVGGAQPAAGGVQVQLGNLGAGVAGASGGNPVAQGVMADAGKGPGKLAPAFSPAVAVQQQSGGPVHVSLRAGDPPGPWWLVIQKGFGPIYIEQVGFGVTMTQDQLASVSLLLDGRLSLFGLTASVDDLQITYFVSNGSPFQASSWGVDLAGLAISSDLGGILLEGGLRKFGDGADVEYVGMLLARFAVYGLSVYGGYGSGHDPVTGEKYASFFAFGAINGPIGGPPAFFVTGIGGGLGINRGLVIPTDMSQFGQYPFIKALDPAAKPASDPMAELQNLRDYFPQVHGNFWFAAGISFNSFALVDGIAVVAVSIGDGFELDLLGLARLALPRPQVALVSIELGLLARFSTKEGVLWIQAQLTDNSWLLYPDVRLTGGFAFVTWFAGPHKGEFVITLGGYHPHFHRDGYPEVPRLGLQWSLSDAISIKGESYFALTSEAVMAGGKLEASAHFGPAWAHVVFGADGIVYFDPFRFEVEVYASIEAGVTIWVLFGTIDISISIGAKVLVAGPKFHGRAEFDVGPVSLAVEFGDADQTAKQFLDWASFVLKYLEAAADGSARAITAVPGKGLISPGTKSTGGGQEPTADGSADHPFLVHAEFEVMFTTTIPTVRVDLGQGEERHLPSQSLGVAPVGKASVEPLLRLRILDAHGADHLATLVGPGGGAQAHIVPDVSGGGSFPLGAWGPPQPDDDRKVPSGDVVIAVDGVRLPLDANVAPGGPPIQFVRVEAEPEFRKPLPFAPALASRPALLAAAAGLTALVPAAADTATRFQNSLAWMSRAEPAQRASVNGRAALAGERAAPPMLGSLAENLAAASPDPVASPAGAPVGRPPVDTTALPPRAIAILSPALAAQATQVARATATSVTDAKSVQRLAAPTLASMQAAIPEGLGARLLMVDPPGAGTDTTIVAAGASPLSRLARGSAAAVGGRAATADSASRLAGLDAALNGAKAPAGRLGPGEVAVLGLPAARFDLDPERARPQLLVDAPARVAVLTHGGEVLADVEVAPATDATGAAVPAPVELARGAERVVVAASTTGPGLAGWHSGQELAYAGWSTALAAGCTVHAESSSIVRKRQRFRAGWVQGAELVAGASVVRTRFVGTPSVVVVVLDEPIGPAAGTGLALSLDGARRPVDGAGAPVPPVAVVAGNRTFLAYAVEADGPVVVGVASEAAVHLAGVLASTGDVDSTVAMLASRGLDTVLAATVPSPDGAGISWADPALAPKTVPAKKKKAAAKKKAPAKKAAAAKKAPAKKAAAAKKAPAKKAVKKARRSR